MKKLGIILTLLTLAAFSGAAQQSRKSERIYKNPDELSIQHTRPNPGLSDKEMDRRIWLWYMEQNHAQTKYASLTGSDLLYILWIDRYGNICDNGSGTMVSFSLRAFQRGDYYTVELYHIAVDCNPILGVLYGRGGELYSAYHTKKQMKLAYPILNSISNIADDIFQSFDDYINS